MRTITHTLTYFLWLSIWVVGWVGRSRDVAVRVGVAAAVCMYVVMVRARFYVRFLARLHLILIFDFYILCLYTIRSICALIDRFGFRF